MLKKRTKIIATIGPASGSVEMLTKLVRAGMNVCRLNFSHGTHETHAEYMRNIREVSQALGQTVAILQDLQGPKIRVANIPEQGRALEDGQEVIFTTDRGDEERIAIDEPRVHEMVKAGERLLLDDGLMEVVVERVVGRNIRGRVLHGGLLLPHKGVNFPDTRLKIASLTEKDRVDLRFGVEQGVDWVALSFVRQPADIREVRELIHSYEEELDLPHEPALRIMAKIEKAEAMEELDDIIAAADALIVARGDLGVEMAFAKVPVMQRRIVDACLQAAKPVAVATQMLDSMIRNPRPTRAEVSDVANAVMDHVDATMLSGETTTGQYPLAAVQAMAAVIQETEASTYDDMPHIVSDQDGLTNIQQVLIKVPQAKAILVASPSGQALRFVARERPEQPVFVVTAEARLARQAVLSWGVTPVLVSGSSSSPELIEAGIKQLLAQHHLVAGDEIIVIAGEPLGDTGMVNLAEVRRV